MKFMFFRVLISAYSNNQEPISDVIKNIFHRMQIKYPETFDKIVCGCVKSDTFTHEVVQNFLSMSLASAKHQVSIKFLLLNNWSPLVETQ